jgi:hypothetical protein
LESVDVLQKEAKISLKKQTAADNVDLLVILQVNRWHKTGLILSQGI